MACNQSKNVINNIRSIIKNNKEKSNAKQIIYKEIYDFLREQYNTLSKYSEEQFKSEIINDGVMKILSSQFFKNLGSTPPQFLTTDVLYNNLKNGFDIKFEDSNNNSYDNTTNRLEIPLSSVDEGLKGTEFLEKYYGTAINVEMYAKSKFNDYIVEHTLINTTDGFAIRSTEKLNEYIKKLKQTLMDSIYNFVSSKIDVDKSDFELYNNDGTYTSNFEKVRNTCWNQLAMDPIQLQSLYNSCMITNRKDLKLKLEAYNNFILLTYFDDYIYSLFKDNIEIADYGTFKSLYRFSKKGADINKTWRTTENIDPEKEVSGVIKLLINTRKLYNPETGAQMSGYQTFNDFQYIVKMIKNIGEDAQAFYIESRDNTLKNKLKEQKISLNTINVFKKYKNLAALINNIRFNAQETLPAIYELLSNKEILSWIKTNHNVFKNWKSRDFINLYSQYKTIFNTEQNSNSIFKLDQTLTNFISEVVDSTTSVKFLQYYLSDKGIKLRSMIDLTYDNIKRFIEDSINTGNSNLLHRWNILQKTYNVEVSGDLNKQKDNQDKSLKNFSMTFRVGSEQKSKKEGIFITVDKNFDIEYEYRNENGEITKGFENIYNKNTRLAQNLLRTLIRDFVQIDTNDVDLMTSLSELYNNNLSDVYKALSSFASRIFLFTCISNNISNDITSISKLSQFIKNNQLGVDVNKGLGEIKFINYHKDSTILERLSTAVATMRGLTSTNTLKDGEGNTQNSAAQSRLLGSYMSQFEKIRNDAKSPMYNSLIIKNPGLLKGVFVAKEFMKDGGMTKSHLDFTIAEQCYSQFIIDYIQQLSFDNDVKDKIFGNGVIGILPSCNSDKPQVNRMAVDLNIEVETNTGIKKLSAMNFDELVYVIGKEFNQIYTAMATKVEDDWNRLFTWLWLKQGYNNTSYKAVLASIITFEQSNNLWIEKSDGTKEILSASWLRDKIRQFNADAKNFSNPITFIDQTHYVEDKNGKLTINKSLYNQLHRWNPDAKIDGRNVSGKYENAKQFFKLQSRYIIRDLVKAGFTVDLSEGLIDSTNKKLGKLLEYKDWYDPNTGLMFIGKYKYRYQATNGKFYEKWLPITKSNIDIATNANYEVELHPELLKYTCLDYLFSEEFLLATVGTHLNHPSKYFGPDANVDEALRKKAQNKRNVSLTAQMKEFTLNMINGIPFKYNLACIKDIKSSCYNLFGKIASQKSWDGATFVHPAVVYLENNSLGADAVGITKKPFIHYYNTATSTGGIIKTAGFGLTNNLARNSFTVRDMIYKMMNHVWMQEDFNSEIDIDITKDYLDHDIVLPGDVYYKQNGKYYKLVNIEHEGSNTYTIRRKQVDQFGNVISKDIVDPTTNQTTNVEETEKIEGVKINSNYQLYKVLGGWNSLELKNNRLVGSENSIKLLVEYMNNVGIAKSTESITRQDQVFQPLKVSDIHYLVTEGAIKQGASNINTMEDLFDHNTSLNKFTIDIIQAGVQLDKEHAAQGAELSLMTQVWNACALRGYSFEQASNVYNSLVKLSNLGTKSITDAVTNFYMAKVNNNADEIKQNKEKLYEVVNKLIIKELATSGNKGANFASNIARGIIQEVRKNNDVNWSEAVLPMSDNSIYGKLTSIIATTLTRKGIRLKIPGLLSIITPAYDFVKLYGGKKLEQYDDGELKALQAQQLPIITNESRNYQDLELGVTYIISDFDNMFKDAIENEFNITIENSEFKLLVDNPSTRFKLINILNTTNSAFKVTESIIDGRNLAAYNVKYEDTEGTKWSLYDADIIKAQYQINNEYNQDSFTKENLVDLFKLVFNNNSTNYYAAPGQLSNFGEDIKYQIQKIFGVNIGRLYSTVSQYINEIMQTPKSPESNELPKPYEIVGLVYDFISTHTIDNLNQIAFNNIKSIINTKENSIIKMLSPEYRGGDQIVVQINGSNHTIVKSTIQIQPYELGMNKTHAEEFGLEEDDQLSDIVENPMFFSKRLIRNYTNTIFDDQFDLELKKMNGKHMYIFDKNAHSIDTSQLTESRYDYREFDDGLWVTDYKGNKIHRLNSTDDKIYVNEDGYKIIVTDNINFYLKSLNYVDLVFSDNLNEDQINTYLKQFEEIKIPRVERAIKSFDIKTTEIGKDGKKINTQISVKDINTAKKRINFGNFAKLSEKNRKSYLESFKENITQKKIVSRLFIEGDRIYASFMKSLEVIASRTPAQSLQSVMPMKIVFFDNPNLNTAFVCDAQLWLQGSDMDIDAVNIATYFINKAGKLVLWSPYADIRSLKAINQSMRVLPFPTGEQLNIQEVAYDKTKSNELLNLLKQIIYIDKEGVHKIRHAKLSKLGVLLNSKIERPTDETKSILEDAIKEKLINQTITQRKGNFIRNLTKKYEGKNISPEELAKKVEDYLIKQTDGIEKEVNSALETLKNNNTDIVDQIFNLIKEIVDHHNTYINKPGVDLQGMLQNYQLYNIFNITADPTNSRQSMSSVDEITSPIKNITKDVEESTIAETELPGNWVVKVTDINRNQVGKQDVGISASALKTFEAFSYAYNYLLNNVKSEDDIKKIHFNIKLKERHNDSIDDKWYHYLANSYTNNPLVYDMNEAASQPMKKLQEQYHDIDQDTDAALTISALLGLSVDNAKELEMFKLNAGTKMLGLYLYGTMIGVPIEQLGQILMSKIGRLTSDLMESNVFTEENGLFSLSNVFNYFNKLTGLYKYKTKIDDKSPYDVVETVLGTVLSKLRDGNLSMDGILKNDPFESTQLATDYKKYIEYNFSNNTLSKTEKTLTKESHELTKRLLQLDNNEFSKLMKAIRGYIPKQVTIGDGKFKYALYKYLNFLEEYHSQLQLAFNENIVEYFNLQQLAKGADEVRKAGTLLKFNQGLEGKPDEIFNIAESIKSIYDITGLEDKNGKKFEGIKIEQLANDEYLNTIIELADNVKHTFNVFKMAANVPHFKKYLQLFATAYGAQKAMSSKFKAVDELSQTYIQKQNAITKKDRLQIIKGIQNFIGDEIIKNYLLDFGKQIFIQADQGYYDSTGILQTGDSNTVIGIQLGTDSGNATFKRWMELTVIPLLKDGYNNFENKRVRLLQSNKFIQHLTHMVYDLNVSHQASINYGLDINMMPKSDNEMANFNIIKSDFNKLRSSRFKMANGKEIILTDLFFLYNMITYSNKIGQNTLTPIFNDILEFGFMKEFFNYEAQLDKSGDLDRLIDFNDNDTNNKIIRYISQRGSLYSSYLSFIYNKLEATNRSSVFYKPQETKMVNQDEDQVYDEQNYEEDQNYDDESYDEDDQSSKAPKRITPYKPWNNNNQLDLNYFIKGTIDNTYKGNGNTYKINPKIEDDIKIEDQVGNKFTIKTPQGDYKNTHLIDLINDELKQQSTKCN